MLVICVIRDLAPEQETPGKKRGRGGVDLIYTRIDLSAFLIGFINEMYKCLRAVINLQTDVYMNPDLT